VLIDTLMEEMLVVLENKRFCFWGNNENFCPFEFKIQNISYRCAIIGTFRLSKLRCQELCATIEVPICLYMWQKN